VNDLAHCADDELLTELDDLERQLARATAASRRPDASGRARVQVDAELLALAERQHLVVQDLRRRRRGPVSAA